MNMLSLNTPKVAFCAMTSLARVREGYCICRLHKVMEPTNLYMVLLGTKSLVVLKATAT